MRTTLDMTRAGVIGTVLMLMLMLRAGGASAAGIPVFDVSTFTQ